MAQSVSPAQVLPKRKGCKNDRPLFSWVKKSVGGGHKIKEAAARLTETLRSAADGPLLPREAERRRKRTLIFERTKGKRRGGGCQNS